MLFLPFKPMEPVASPVLPAGGRHLFQVKWDGVRIIAHVSRHKILLHNRKMHERTPHYPELWPLTGLVEGDVILDGEIVALKDGKPHFPLVLERDLVAGASLALGQERIRRLAASLPVYYLVFDIIYHNGEDLTRLPLVKRQERLFATLRPNEVLHLTESFADGSALLGAVSAKKMEGIVAKEKDSRYLPGKKNSAWLKIKVRQRQLVVIGGYTLRDGQISSLLTGAYLNGELYYTGRVGSGLSARELAELKPYLEATRRASPPFAGLREGRDKFWVEPALVVLVEFQEWTEDLRMRQPVVKGFTLDRPQDCVLI